MPKKLNKKKKKKAPRIAGLKITRTNLVSLAPHPQNVRVHDEENIAAIMRSLEEFGQQTPLVVNQDGLVLKGNGTLEALRRLDYKDVAVVVAKGLSEEQELAYAIADNKTGDMSSFDFAKLADVIKGLDDAGFDLAATGFQEFELQPLMQGEFDPGEVGDMPTVEDRKIYMTFTDDDVPVIKRAMKKYQALLGDDKSKLETMILYLCKEYTAVRKKLR